MLAFGKRDVSGTYTWTMTVCIRAFCPAAVASGPEQLVLGIGNRLALLTYLFDIEHWAEPTFVLRTLSCARPQLDWYLRWSEGARVLVGEHRFGATARRECERESAVLIGLGSDADDVLSVVSQVVSITEFSLFGSDQERAGKAVALAAAAHMAECSGGLVHVQDVGWFAPQPGEVRPVLAA